MSQSDVWLSLSQEVARLAHETSLFRMTSFLAMIVFAAFLGHVVRTAVTWLWKLDLDRPRRLAMLGSLVQLAVGCMAIAGLVGHGLRVAPGVTLLVGLVAAPTSGIVLRAPLQNLLAGLTLLFQRNLREGDDIRLFDGRAVRVEQIRLTSTLGRGDADSELIIPNALLLSSLIQKFTPQPGVAHKIFVLGPRAPLPDELEKARALLLFSPFRAAGSTVDVRFEPTGPGLELSLRVLSESAKRPATRELTRKVTDALGWSSGTDG